MGFWDDPDLAAGGDYLSLAAPGDTISGTITGMRRRVFDDGSVAAELFLQTDAGTIIGGQQVAPGDYTFTGGAYAVKKEFNLQRPNTGDHVRIVRGQLEQIKGGRSVGHYEVVVTHGSGVPQQQAPQQQQFQQAQQGPNSPQAWNGQQFAQQPAQQAPVQYQPPQGQQQPVQGGPGPFQQQAQPAQQQQFQQAQQQIQQSAEPPF